MFSDACILKGIIIAFHTSTFKLAHSLPTLQIKRINILVEDGTYHTLFETVSCKQMYKTSVGNEYILIRLLYFGKVIAIGCSFQRTEPKVPPLVYTVNPQPFNAQRK